MLTNGRTRQSGVTSLNAEEKKTRARTNEDVSSSQVPTCYSSGCLSKYLSTVYPTATVIMTANYQLAGRPANVRVTAAAGFNARFHQHTQTHTNTQTHKLRQSRHTKRISDKHFQQPGENMGIALQNVLTSVFFSPPPLLPHLPPPPKHAVMTERSWRETRFIKDASPFLFPNPLPL